MIPSPKQFAKSVGTTDFAVKMVGADKGGKLFFTLSQLLTEPVLGYHTYVLLLAAMAKGPSVNYAKALKQQNEAPKLAYGTIDTRHFYCESTQPDNCSRAWVIAVWG